MKRVGLSLLLVASHVAALAVGATAGLAYPVDAEEGWTAAWQVLASFPETEAAELAFRFGTSEQARLLLEAMPVPPAEEELYESATSLRALRLAVVYEKLHNQEREQATLEYLRERCLKRGWKKCSLDDMRKAAKTVAKQSGR